MYGLDTETVSSAKELTLFCNENKTDKSQFSYGIGSIAT